jgi:hypothetical protein
MCHVGLQNLIPFTYVSKQFGKIDAYCVVSFNGSQQKTETKKSNYNPVFQVGFPALMWPIMPSFTGIHIFWQRVHAFAIVFRVF